MLLRLLQDGTARESGAVSCFNTETIPLVRCIGDYTGQAVAQRRNNASEYF